jgi:hypothetical protein
VDAIMRLDRRVEQGNVVLDDRSHRPAVALSQRDAAFDVGEEEGNRS